MDWKNFNIEKYIENFSADLLNDSQKDSLRALNFQLRNNGAIIADEVGTGKTRIACALVQYVCKNQRGRVAVVIPRGLIKQWQRELRFFSETNSTNMEPIIILNFKNLIVEFEAITTTSRPVFISQTFRFPIVKSGTDKWKFLLLAISLNKKMHDKSFDNYRNFAKGEAENFIKLNCQDDGSVGYHLIQWCDYLVNNKLIFFNQQVRSLKDKYSFNFGDESSFHIGSPGHKIMVDEVIGNMFGFFDLIIIDEAHKSKGDNSSLSNILKMIRATPDKEIHQRCVGMTATPIELHEDQWLQLLRRINVEKERCDELRIMINDYSKAFQSMSTLKVISNDAFTNFESCSKEFEQNLGQFVTRRKKEIDKMYLDKVEEGGAKIHPHRDYREETIKFTDLNDADKKWVFLHECLSKSAKGLSLKNKKSSIDNPTESLELYEGIKRLDSYFSRGHTLKSFELDKVFSEDNKNKVNDKFKFERAKIFAEKWISSEQALYKHPKIRRAIDVIDRYSDKNEKILVFGCFSGPIKTLERCLNARYILKSINKGKTVRIPKDFLTDNEQREIFKFEAALLKIPLPSDKDLHSNEYKYEAKRKEVGEKVDLILREIAGLRKLDHEEENIKKKKKLITARATDEILYSDCKNLDSLIRELLVEVSLEEKSVKESELKDSSDKAFSEHDDLNIEMILHSIDDKALSGSEYTMLLDGSTDFLRRSIIQTEFNRRGGFPRVLIAQSQVGKEGLNLHKACCVVLLFNADWNPGVIEQQVGRVDRLNSLWEDKKNEWIKSSELDNRPVIEIIELHFDGTYDQNQWEKLKQRKQTLLYHLYNSVDAENVWSEEDEARILKIMPDFSPAKFLVRNGYGKLKAKI